MKINFCALWTLKKKNTQEKIADSHFHLKLNRNKIFIATPFKVKFRSFALIEINNSLDVIENSVFQTHAWGLTQQNIFHPYFIIYWRICTNVSYLQMISISIRWIVNECKENVLIFKWISVFISRNMCFLHLVYLTNLGHHLNNTINCIRREKKSIFWKLIFSRSWK